MGFSVHQSTQVQASSRTDSLQALPYGILQLGIAGIDVSGKKPVVSLAGRVASRTLVVVGQPRIDFATRTAYIPVDSAKNDAGQKGKVDDFTRKVELEISLKRARSEGPWKVALVNEKSGEQLVSSGFDMSRV